MDWTVFFAAAGVFILAVLGLSVGALLGRRPLRGSCGGLSTLHGKTRVGEELSCEFCDLEDPNDCPRVKAAREAEADGEDPAAARPGDKT